MSILREVELVSISDYYRRRKRIQIPRAEDVGLLGVTTSARAEDVFEEAIERRRVVVSQVMRERHRDDSEAFEFGGLASAASVLIYSMPPGPGPRMLLEFLVDSTPPGVDVITWFLSYTSVGTAGRQYYRQRSPM